MDDTAPGSAPTTVTAPTTAPTTATGLRDDAASRRWRTVWRTHFYAGVVAAPILLLLAITGLVILYTQPITDFARGDITLRTTTGTSQSLSKQAEAVRTAFPDLAVVAMTTPVDQDHATAFGLSNGRDAYVDPGSLEVLGTRNPAGGVVGLANRLHGFLNNDAVEVSLPTLSGLVGEGPLLGKFSAGDALLEVFGGWALILACSGVYLWWPRQRDSGKALFLPRLRKKGRARWRDLHAVPGFLLSFVLVFFIVTGMPWSGYWGGNWAYLAGKITPPVEVTQPVSAIARLGDVDRLGNKLNWPLQDDPIPASAGGSGGSNSSSNAGSASDDEPGHVGHLDEPAPIAGGELTAAQVSLDVVAAAAADEGMQPGYIVIFPEDDMTDAAAPVFGSFALTNPWPSKTQQSLTVYVDQFRGTTLGRTTADDWGGVSKGTDYLVSTHMGTQFGVVNRIVMTFGCVGVTWSIISATVMYTKRRRAGSLGLPRRPADIRLAHRLGLIALVIGIVYPLWGLTALVVMTFDRFVIRRAPRLRVAFGQR